MKNHLILRPISGKEGWPGTDESSARCSCRGGRNDRYEPGAVGESVVRGDRCGIPIFRGKQIGDRVRKECDIAYDSDVITNRPGSPRLQRCLIHYNHSPRMTTCRFPLAAYIVAMVIAILLLPYHAVRGQLADSGTISSIHVEQVSGVNTPYHEYAPCITPDGLALYFVSNRPGLNDIRHRERWAPR